MKEHICTTDKNKAAKLTNNLFIAQVHYHPGQSAIGFSFTNPLNLTSELLLRLIRFFCNWLIFCNAIRRGALTLKTTSGFTGKQSSLVSVQCSAALKGCRTCSQILKRLTLHTTLFKRQFDPPNVLISNASPSGRLGSVIFMYLSSIINPSLSHESLLPPLVPRSDSQLFNASQHRGNVMNQPCGTWTSQDVPQLWFSKLTQSVGSVTAAKTQSAALQPSLSLSLTLSHSVSLSLSLPQSLFLSLSLGAYV